MIRRRTGPMSLRFSGRLEPLDHRYVLAAMFSVHDLAIEDPVIDPAQIAERATVLLRHAAVLENWQQVPPTVPRTVGTSDIFTDSIDIATSDVVFGGNVVQGASQNTTGTIRGIKTGSLERMDPIVNAEPNSTMTLVDQPNTSIALNWVELPAERPPFFDLPLIMESPTHPIPTLPPTEPAIDSPTAVPPVDEPLGVNLLNEGSTRVDDLAVDTEPRQQDGNAELDGELPSPSRSGLTIRQPLETPTESGESESEQEQVSDWSLGVDLVWMSRVNSAWGGEYALDASTVPTPLKTTPLDDAIDDGDVSLSEQRQENADIHAGRLRPTIEWQDTGDLTVGADTWSAQLNKPASELHLAAGEVRSIVPKSWRNSRIELSERAGRSQSEELYDSNPPTSSWVESCFSIVKKWFADVSGGSWRRITAEWIPAIVATVALVRLLDNDRHEPHRETESVPLARRARHRRSEIARGNALSSNDC